MCILTDPALLSQQSRIPEWQFILQNWELHHWFTQTGLGWTRPPTASWCPAWRLVTRAPGIVEWMEGTSRLRRTISKSQVKYYITMPKSENLDPICPWSSIVNNNFVKVEAFALYFWKNLLFETLIININIMAVQVVFEIFWKRP